jgi:hypothetical protein
MTRAKDKAPHQAHNGEALEFRGKERREYMEQLEDFFKTVTAFAAGGIYQECLSFAVSLTLNCVFRAVREQV